MAMGTGGRRGGLTATINMTPMIDVVMVLLIVFMVVQMGLQRGLAVQVPPPEPSSIDSHDPTALVLQVRAGGRYAVNHQPLDGDRAREQLAAILAPRPRKVLFVAGEGPLSYGEIVAAVDVGRAAGAEVIGLSLRN
jgi:biopolymer transport protein TolR